MLLLSGFFLQGCASKLPTHAEMKEQLKDYNLPKPAEQGKAIVYVVRPSSLGTLIRFNVFLDDEEASSEMGYTRGSQYIYFTVSPGPHTIKSKAENWAEIQINPADGELVFLQQNPEMGLIMARNSLFQVQNIEGKYRVKNLKPGTIIKTEK
ncbi:hypothetical protein MMIC_P0939 [Mariprofundus micogutta]|uniref:DUF2846 domain-containing protein n=2 Tax=Mariprofundus micogutta TaxID=1921010 RepID=A0A1L8CM32_9PROT|nr:hypothetical protein MMIC_P0939 [Mariprofundus micogutta]